MKTTFALIGLGGISQFFISAVQKHSGAELVALCDNNPKKYKNLHSQHQLFFPSVNSLVKSNVCDAVIITTPNYTHAPIIKQCLRAGLHVLCEKPLALTWSQAQDLAREAQQSKRLLMTAFHRRYNANVADLILPRTQKTFSLIYARYFENIREHATGEPWYFNRAKSGGGCIMDNGINVIDVLRHLAGELTVGLSTIRYKKKFGYRFDDKATILLHHKTGQAIIDLDWSYPGEKKDLTLIDQHGNIEYRDLLNTPTRKFKGSLWHEYEGILNDFLVRLALKKFGSDKDGLEALKLVEEIYDDHL